MDFCSPLESLMCIFLLCKEAPLGFGLSLISFIERFEMSTSSFFGFSLCTEDCLFCSGTLALDLDCLAGILYSLNLAAILLEKAV